jgi:SAM-dependent methyltransferase
MNVHKRDISSAWKPGSITVLLPTFATHLVEMAEVVPECQMLDIATGAGTCAIAFAEKGVTKVNAIDIKPDQVDSCREQVVQKGLSNVEVWLGDARKLPFDDDSFDLITGTGALSNIDEPEKALVEVYRVLKPNGQLAIGDYLVPERAHEVYGVLSAFRYGSRRPLLDYTRVQDLIYEVGFQIVNYRPLRWLYPLKRQLRSHWPEILKERYCQAFLDMNLETQNALRLHQRGDQWVMVFDCFALVATKFKGRPMWEYSDLENKDI